MVLLHLLIQIHHHSAFMHLQSLLWRWDLLQNKLEAALLFPSLDYQDRDDVQYCVGFYLGLEGELNRL